MKAALVASPAGPAPEIRSELERAAKTFGIVLAITPVSGPDDFDAVLARAKREGAAGIIAGGDYVTFQHRKRFVEAALKYRLPGIYWTREYVEEGGRLAYTADMTDLRRRAATFVDKILKGVKPADLKRRPGARHCRGRHGGHPRRQAGNGVHSDRDGQ